MSLDGGIPQRMSMVLPPLTELIDRGAAGGHEFERLMHQLLLQEGRKHGFKYEPVSGAGGDGGLDGWVERGLREFEGTVAFQFKWLWEDIHKGSKAQQIKDSLQRAARHPRHPANWVLVTPWQLKQSEKDWLDEQGASVGLRVSHWGQDEIIRLLREFPALFARYYPHEAAALPERYVSGKFHDFAGQYLSKVAGAHRYLRMIGMPLESLKKEDERKIPPLSKLFIPLRFVTEGRGTEEVRSLAELLASRKSTVIRGDPGTGKTTLLAFVSLLLSGQELAGLEGYTRPSGAVPLLISLRQFVRAGGNQVGFSMLEYLVRHARSDFSLEHAHPFFFEAALRMGEAVVLFDGLDEVEGAPARSRMAGLIRAFHEEYPACPVWVTSRIYGYTADVRLPEESFEHVRLARLDDGQVTDFIRRWYVIQIPDNERERTEFTTSLTEAVQRTPSVRRLAGNPLLLTLMTLIHRGLGKLPQERGELYEKCVGMLLDTWQDARRKGDKTSHAFTRLELEPLRQKDYLAHLALYVQEKNQRHEDEDSRGIVSREAALEVLASRHLELSRRQRPGMTQGDAREEMKSFLDYISDQTGLLIDRGGGQLAFIHLSFQEYLAAWIFVQQSSRDNLKFFTQHLGRTTWEEVLLLRLYIVLKTPGAGGPGAFDAIVKAVFRKLKHGGPTLGWLMLLRALRDNLQFTPADRDVILRRAIEIWSQAPADAEAWLTALEEVNLFSESAKKRLEELLEEVCQQAEPARAVACLHLRAKLGLPVGATLVGSNPRLLEMLPDLTVFMDEPGMAEVLAQQATVAHWQEAFAVLEGECLYGLTLTWAKGDSSPGEPALRAAAAWLEGKVVADLQSRKEFVARQQRSEDMEIFARTGRVSVVLGSYHLEVPFSGFQVGATVPTSLAAVSGQLWQPALALSWFEEAKRRGPVADMAFRQWLVNYVSCQLQPFPSSGLTTYELADMFGGEFADLFGRIIARGFFRDFIRALLRTLGRNFDGAIGHSFGRAFFDDVRRAFFGGDVGRAFVGTLGRDIGRAFGLAFGRAFGSDFGRVFGRAFGRDFGRPFGRAFVRDFVRDFGRDFVRELGRDLLGKLSINPESPDWEGQWGQALSDEENLVTLFKSDQFWTLSTGLGWGSGIQLDMKRGKAGMHLKNPLALLLFLIDTFTAGLINHLMTSVRHLTVREPLGIEWDEVVVKWLFQNPATVYMVALSWEEQAGEFASRRGRLSGGEGALMLVHAAYARLMAGVPCEGPVWTQLLKERDMEDPLIQRGYLLHEIAHFRDVEQNVRAWEALPVKFLPPDPLFLSRSRGLLQWVKRLWPSLVTGGRGGRSGGGAGRR